jgi:hypothetical protein
MKMSEFVEFPKLYRLHRDIVITEKLDGTNAQVYIDESGEIKAGSRNRWLTIGDDNFGFAYWVESNKEELLKLGVGRHYGEWCGAKIQRGYNLKEKKFVLFNTERWLEQRPSCCDVVPILYKGMFSESKIMECLDDLKINGSKFSPGFMKPEGIVIFHTQGNFGLKKTLEKDEVPKSMVKE